MTNQVSAEIPVSRPSWGGWRLNRETYCLDLYIEGNWRYEVDLERCLDSAQVLDWIFQTQWRDECYDGLIDALRDVLHPQRNLCSWGHNKVLTKAQVREIVDNFR